MVLGHHYMVFRAILGQSRTHLGHRGGRQAFWVLLQPSYMHLGYFYTLKNGEYFLILEYLAFNTYDFTHRKLI